MAKYFKKYEIKFFLENNEYELKINFGKLLLYSI